MELTVSEDPASITKESRRPSRPRPHHLGGQKRLSPDLDPEAEPSLDSLPSEILLEIFLELPPSTLLAITLVSTRFNSLSDDAWRRLCFVKYQNLENHDFERLISNGTDLVHELGTPKKLYNVRPRRHATSSPKFSKNRNLTSASAPLPVRRPHSPHSLPLPATTSAPNLFDTNSDSRSSNSSGIASQNGNESRNGRLSSDGFIFRRSNKGKDKSPTSSPASSQGPRRRSDPMTDSRKRKGSDKSKEKDKYHELKGKDKEREDKKAEEERKSSDYESPLSQSPMITFDFGNPGPILERPISENKSSDSSPISGRKKIGSSEDTSSEYSEGEVEERVGWKFLYFNKTRIENVRWLIKKDPVWVRQFYTREEARSGGTAETLYKHHLFPTVVRLHQDYVITGSGAYEMVSDPTTFMIGNRVIRLWDVHTGEMVRQLEGHAGAILNMDCKNGMLLSTSRYSSRNLLLWNIETGTNLASLNGHNRSVFQATFEANERIYSCSKDKTFRVWDERDASCIKTYDCFPESVRCYAVWRNGTEGSVVCAIEDKSLRLLDLTTSKITSHIDTTKQVTTVATIGNTCIVGLSNMIKQIDLRSGEVVRAINKKSNGSHIPGFVRELYVDEDKLLFSTTEGKLGVVDWNSGKILALLSLSRPRLSFAYDPITQRVATGDSHSWVKLWNFGDEESPEPESVVRATKCTIS